MELSGEGTFFARASFRGPFGLVIPVDGPETVSIAGEVEVDCGDAAGCASLVEGEYGLACEEKV